MENSCWDQPAHWKRRHMEWGSGQGCDDIVSSHSNMRKQPFCEISIMQGTVLLTQVPSHTSSHTDGWHQCDPPMEDPGAVTQSDTVWVA